MADINQYAISKILGSEIKPFGPARFGHFNLQGVVANRIKADAEPKHGESEDPPATSYEDDAIVVKAFESVRDGAPTDELLWDRELAKAFAEQCRRLGLHASDAFFLRRLINVRKNIKRYREHDIEICPATRKELHPSIVPEYAPVIEFALVRLRFRYGASIDDILIDPALGDQFEDLAKQIAPEVSSKDLRLGALYIRKNRGLEKARLAQMKKLRISRMDSAWHSAGTLADIGPDAVPSSPGLLELKEDQRYLYIAQNQNLALIVRQLCSGRAFELMSNGFWQPKLARINLLYAAGETVAGANIVTWERRLIYEREPVFNWPIPKKAA